MYLTVSLCLNSNGMRTLSDWLFQSRGQGIFRGLPRAKGWFDIRRKESRGSSSSPASSRKCGLGCAVRSRLCQPPRLLTKRPRLLRSSERQRAASRSPSAASPRVWASTASPTHFAPAGPAASDDTGRAPNAGRPGAERGARGQAGAGSHAHAPGAADQPARPARPAHQRAQRARAGHLAAPCAGPSGPFLLNYTLVFIRSRACILGLTISR